MKCEPVAIVGYGVLYPPNANSADVFWENIKSGVAGIREITDDVWSKESYFDSDEQREDKTYCKESAYLDKNIELDSYLASFKLEKQKLIQLNRTQKMVLFTILQALEKGGLTLKDISKSNLIIGNMLGDLDICDYFLSVYGEKYFKLLEQELALPADDNSKLKAAFVKKLKQKFGTFNSDNDLFPSKLVTDLSELLALAENSFIVDGACAGSLLAVEEGIKLLHSNEADLCIVTGVLGNMGVTGNVAFSKIGGLSHTKSKPLDRSNDGLTPGEGAGTIIIKRLSQAKKDGNKILGVISGSGVASDGSGQSIYAPSTSGQYLAMKKSLVRAGLKMNEIDYVEMHATGTPVGDLVELESLVKLCQEVEMTRKLRIGSVKSQIGHSFSAAGMANLIKVLKAMEHGQFPPTHHFTEFSNQAKALARDYLEVNTKLIPWETKAGVPKRALVNAFGFGGINGNLLVEEYLPAYHDKKLASCSNEKKTYEFAITGVGSFDSTYHSYAHRKDHKTDQNFNFPFIKYKIPPKILNKIDYAQQIALIAATEAIENGLAKTEDKTKVGVYVGSNMGLQNAYYTDLRIRTTEYTNIMQQLLGTQASAKLAKVEQVFKQNFEAVKEDTLPGFMDNIVASRVSNYHNLQGSNAVYDRGPQSFEVALNQALLSLINDENDVVIVGGVNGNSMKEYGELLKTTSMATKTGAYFFVIKKVTAVSPTSKVLGKFSKQIGKKIKITAENATYAGASGALTFLEKLERDESLVVVSADAEVSELAIFTTSKQRLCELSVEELLKASVNSSFDPEAEIAIVYRDETELVKKLRLVRSVFNNGENG